MALAVGRGRTARQCARSGGVLRWAGHEPAGGRQQPGSKPPWKRAVLSRLAHSRSPGWGRRRHKVRRCRALWHPAGTDQRACLRRACGRQAGRARRGGGEGSSPPAVDHQSLQGRASGFDTPGSAAGQHAKIAESSCGRRDGHAGRGGLQHQRNPTT